MRDTVATAKVRAALAYTHGMDDDSAAAMLTGLPMDELPLTQGVFARIVALGQAVDRKTWAECDALSEQLVQLEPKLLPNERDRLEGMSLGTRGRAKMHQRLLGEALPLLQAAVHHHEQHTPREVGRSRLYLVMALRMQGELRAALGQLEAAQREIDHCERRLSPAYGAQTQVFLYYEMTRTLVAGGQYAAAVATGERALGLARGTGSWWPLLGILRTVAWAYRGAERRADAERVVEELSTWAGRSTPLAAGLAAALQQEASGPVIEDGEVY